MRIFGHVVLDSDSFRALAHPTRIDILKRLDEHQMTVSDLARSLTVSKSTAFKHLERLCQAGLVDREDAERKWIYYRISRKGSKMLHSENVTFSLLIGWAGILVGALLIATAVYLAWFPVPAMPGLDSAPLVLGLLLAGCVSLMTIGTAMVRWNQWRVA